MVSLFVLPARDVSKAVILRRGPSRWYHVIEWDTANDRFVHGAWIKGRIYENSCDVSPDGTLLLTSVLQGSRHSTEFTHAWTAISRVPWLQALTLWPQGETYGGGGRFRTNREVMLRPVWCQPKPKTHPDFPLRGIRVVEGTAPDPVPRTDVPGADWCGRDFLGNMICTRGGQLFRRGEGIDELIADFTDLRPDPQPAPDWAGAPL